MEKNPVHSIISLKNHNNILSVQHYLINIYAYFLIFCTLKWKQRDCHGFSNESLLFFVASAQCYRNVKCHCLMLEITFPNKIDALIAVNGVCKWAIWYACMQVSFVMWVCVRVFFFCFIFMHWSLSLKDAGMWFVNEKQTQIKQSQQHALAAAAATTTTTTTTAASHHSKMFKLQREHYKARERMDKTIFFFHKKSMECMIYKKSKLKTLSFARQSNK